MDYQILKKEIQEIADIAQSVPAEFREKCFDALLSKLLNGDVPASPAGGPPAPNSPQVHAQTVPPPPAAAPAPVSGSTHIAGSLPVTTQLRVLMTRTGLTEDDIKKVLFVEDNDVHFVKEPAGGKIAEGQVDWALLMALKNCILNNNLSADPEATRSMCQEKGYYDSPNFAKNFKNPATAKLFKGAMVGMGEAQQLTNEGQTELAALVKKLGSSS